MLHGYLRLILDLEISSVTDLPFIFLQIIFLETLCNDERIIERNIRLKIQQSPDYSEEYDARSVIYTFRPLSRLN